MKPLSGLPQPSENNAVETEALGMKHSQRITSMKTNLNTYSRDLLLGALFVALAIIVQTWIMGIAIVFLDIGLIIGLAVWAAQAKKSAEADIMGLYLTAVSIQCIHFLEEYLTGFQTEFPQLFGYSWSDQQFVALNLSWLAVFVLAGVGVHYRMRLSYLVVYFFAIIGGIANGLAHPLLSLMKGGYFPGLYTSPFALIVGLALLRRLMKGSSILRPNSVSG
jgi:hypothetical protein